MRRTYFAFTEVVHFCAILGWLNWGHLPLNKFPHLKCIWSCSECCGLVCHGICHLKYVECANIVINKVLNLKYFDFDISIFFTNDKHCMEILSELDKWLGWQIVMFWSYRIALQDLPNSNFTCFERRIKKFTSSKINKHRRYPFTDTFFTVIT